MPPVFLILGGLVLGGWFAFRNQSSGASPTPKAAPPVMPTATPETPAQRTAAAEAAARDVAATGSKAIASTATSAVNNVTDFFKGFVGGSSDAKPTERRMLRR